MRYRGSGGGTEQGPFADTAWSVAAGAIPRQKGKREGRGSRLPTGNPARMAVGARTCSDTRETSQAILQGRLTEPNAC
jgi:hypothetical protein